MNKSLQEILDQYGASTGCNNWEGFVRECIQNPDQVIDKFNELLQNFKTQNNDQIVNAMLFLQQKAESPDNWAKNSFEYSKRLIKIKIV